MFFAVYELQSIGSDGETKYFHKPWAMTTLMFIGELAHHLGDNEDRMPRQI
jgi:hypothetical protein